MSTVLVEVEVYCPCGNLLNSLKDGQHYITIEPCEDCLENARQEGYDKRKEEEE
jgi:hypothetical protein